MTLRTFIFVVGMVVISFALREGLYAQDPPREPGPPDGRPLAQPQGVRNQALRQLGLSPEQFRQIRRINMERKPLMDEAQKRLRMANRALDEAIYANNANEAEVQARLKDLQAAQAEVAKIRFMSEFAHRRVLTAEQLERFRELRRRFDEGRPMPQNRSFDEGGPPDRPQQRPARQVIRPNRPTQ